MAAASGTMAEALVSAAAPPAGSAAEAGLAGRPVFGAGAPVPSASAGTAFGSAGSPSSAGGETASA